MTAGAEARVLSAREHALHVAVLDVVGDEVADQYKATRKAAEAVFAPARADGQTQQKVLLPDGTDIGLISIRAGEKDVAVPEEALEGWVEKRLPDGMEEYADPASLANAEVLDVFRAVFPDLIRRRIRPATRTALLKEIEKSGGWLVDKATGDKEKVGDVTDLKPTGAFSYRPSAEARDLVIAAWQRGDLEDIVLSPLALPAAAPASTADASRPASPQPDEEDPDDWDKTPFGALYSDEHGFLDPERAAMHAVLVQKGYSTPPIEAYRMLRDGGVHADRAREFMAAFGLDPDDPREGKDTPWPLPAPDGGVPDGG